MQDCPTRWNSSFFMLAWLVELQDSIITDLCQSKDARELDVTPTEWLAAEVVVDVLEALETVNRTLCGEKYVTLLFSLPLLSGLVNRSLALYATDKAPVPAHKREIAKSIKRRFQL